MDIIDVSWLQLGFGFLILLLPGIIFWRHKAGLNSKLLLAATRMTLQLFLVGYYLQYLFDYDNLWLNMIWILAMIIIANFAIIDRSELQLRKAVIAPVFLATFFGICIIDIFFLGIVIQLPEILTAQYAIPITGMVLGNCLGSNVIGINSFFSSLHQQQEQYRYYLACGASRKEALFPFVRSALKKSANPTLASMATVGLVFLPGMMTGQILSGASPLIAIKYQIMIMLAIFSGTVLSVYLAITFASYTVFTPYNILDPRILKKQ